jgi:hypothetical protein
MSGQAMAFINSMNGMFNSTRTSITTAYQSAKTAANGAYDAAYDKFTDLTGIGGDVESVASYGPQTRGGKRRKKIPGVPPNVVSPPEDVMQGRATISPMGSSAMLFGGAGAIMEPLRARGALIFPYTPTLQVGSTAEYEPSNISHTITKNQSYTRTFINEIVLSAEFTAQTLEEARYMLACMHFFRSVTKSYFGESNGDLAGAPPPVVKFNYLGDQMFNNVPVVIKGYTYTLPPDVDYVIIDQAGISTQVPAHLTMQITMDVYYNPLMTRTVFNLAEFKNGNLLSNGFI